MSWVALLCKTRRSIASKRPISLLTKRSWSRNVNWNENGFHQFEPIIICHHQLIRKKTFIVNTFVLLPLQNRTKCKIISIIWDKRTECIESIKRCQSSVSRNEKLFQTFWNVINTTFISLLPVIFYFPSNFVRSVHSTHCIQQLLQCRKERHSIL